MQGLAPVVRAFRFSLLVANLSKSYASSRFEKGVDRQGFQKNRGNQGGRGNPRPYLVQTAAAAFVNRVREETARH